MATRHLTRSFHTTKQFLSSSLTSRSLSNRPFSSSSLFRLRPLGAISARFHQLSPSVTAIRHSSTCQTPNWSNRPPRETILLDGCDFKHWLVVMEKPEQEERDKIIDSYIKTLATVVGSEEEARKKIYSVSTRHYYGFGALVSEELSYKIKDMPGVRWVLPDSYLDVKKKSYGGEPFINGQAVPYDPKYHEEWLRNNTYGPNERTPRKFDRSRFTERRQNVNKQYSQTPMANPSRQNPRPNMAEVQPSNAKGAHPMANPSRQNPIPNMAEVQLSNAKGALEMQMPYSKTGSWSNMGGMQANSMKAAPNVGRVESDNMRGAPNTGGMQANSTAVAPNTGGMQANSTAAAPDTGGIQSDNIREAPKVGGIQSNNMGEAMPPYNNGVVPPNNTRGVPNNTLYSHWNRYNWGGMHCNMGEIQTNNMVGAPKWGEVQPNSMGGMQPNNMGDVPPNMGGVQPNNMEGVPPNMGGVQPNNMGGVPANNMEGMPNNSPNFQCWNGQNSGGNPYYPGGMQANNMAAASSWGGVQPNNMWEMQPYNMGGMPNNVPNFQYWNGYNGGGMPYNLSGMLANNMVGAPNWGGVPPNTMGEMPPYNGGVLPHNMGGMPNNATNFQYSNGYNSGGMSYQNREMPGPGENRECQNRYTPNMAGGNTYQTRDMPESDVPPPHQTINRHAVDK